LFHFLLLKRYATANKPPIAKINSNPGTPIAGVAAGTRVGGHIFSETVIYAGEIYIQELLGTPLEREYDDRTGLSLWKEC